MLNKLIKKLVGNLCVFRAGNCRIFCR